MLNLLSALKTPFFTPAIYNIAMYNLTLSISDYGILKRLAEL